MLNSFKINIATKNYQISLSTGYNYGDCITKISLCYTKLGDFKNSYKWISKGLKTPKSLYVGDLVLDSDFNDFRKTNYFKSIYPQDSTLNRNEKWKTDIKFLKERLEAKHYNVFSNITKDEWNSAFDKLLRSLEKTSNAMILANLMKIIAKVGDGHTFIRPPIVGEYKLHLYPFKLYMFKEGLYVVQTSKNYKKALGLKLTHINAMPIENVLKKMSEVISVDNEIGLLERLDFNIMFSEVLHALNITNDPKNTSFTFQYEDGKEVKMNVKANEFNPNLLSEKLNESLTEKPLHMKRENKFFWAQEIKDMNAMYIKVNLNLSNPQNDIRAFYKQVFDTISKKKIKRLIVDLRNCPGGNSFNNKTLIKLIMSNKTLDKENGLFTIIGRKTFSAAMNLTTDLETWTNTRFIGEPTGSKPNFIGETNFITLPNTKLQVSISDAYWQRSVSWDKREWIAPHIYVQNDFSDFKNGTDNILTTIKTMILEKTRND